VTLGNNPDLIEIDGASNNSVDDIRSLRETVGYAPNMGRYKVYLIDEVHMLSKAAFNALLKTLEAPPPHVIFLFATTEPDKIIDTILSRVQRFDFKRIPAEAVAKRLDEIAKNEGASVSEASLRAIARCGEGSMRDAQSLLDKVISFGGPGEITDAQVSETLGLIDRSLLHRMVEGLCTGNAAMCLDVIEQVYGYGYELTQFTTELLEILRHATFLRMAPEVHRHVDLSEDEVALLGELLRDVSPDVLTRQFTALLDVHEQIARSQRPRIVLDMAIARLTDIRPAAPVGQLIARLEALEGRLRKQGGGGGTSGGGPSHSRRSSAPSRRSPTTRRASGTSTKTPPASVPSPPKATPPSAPKPPTTDATEASLQASKNRPPEAKPTGIEALRLAFASLDGELLALREATLTHRPNDVLIELPGGRALALAQGLVDNERLQTLVEAHMDAKLPVVLQAIRGTGTREETQQTDANDLLRDPAVRRIVTGLRAKILEVEDLADTLESDDP
jgi:DNA polymerase-3 subunit gamma/tau